MNITQQHIDKIIQIAKSFGASRLLLFGSALTNPDTARDIDLAVDGVPGMKIFELAGEIELAIRKPIDMIPMDESTPFIEYISRNGKFLYKEHCWKKKN
jgi:uncharacterized protein